MLLAKTNIPYFLHASMNSSWYYSFINIYVSGGNGAIGNLNMKDLNRQIVPIPSQSTEQTSIGRLFRKLDDLITLHGQKLEKLRHVKQALLGKMFV